MKILIVNVSNSANYQSQKTGWGEKLASQLEYPNIKVINVEQEGTSPLQEKRFLEKLITMTEVKDVVLLGSFIRGSLIAANYHFWENVIDQLQKVGARPILCSQVEKRNFIVYHQDQLDKRLIQRLKQLAREKEVPFFDLNTYIYNYYEYLDEHENEKLFSLQKVFSPIKGSVETQEASDISSEGACVVAHYIAIRLKPYIHSHPLFDKYYYGACMYPEMWSPSIMAEDITQMKRLKMNFTRIGEFVWSSLEPTEGVYDFSLLENSLSLFAANNIDVCLCIPTATPPRWMSFEHSERLITNMDGTKMIHGSRQHICTNNDYFRRKAYQLTQKIAEITSKYPNVIAIQLDNEFKCHVDMCYCDSCKDKWHDWLATEYLEIKYLNAAWGTKVWSEEYTSFIEVPMPQKTPFIHNSSLMNAFRRFTAESLNDFASGLCDCIRMETAIPITHNTALGFNLLNEELFANLDVVGFDTYQPHTNYPGYTLNLDLWRNLKQTNIETLLLETSTSHVGHLENYVSGHPTGYVPMEAFTGFASGLRSFNYWHFRSHRFGVEQPHSCVLTAWGEPDRGYQDVVQTGELIEKLTPLLTASRYQHSNIALVYSDDSRRMFNVETGGIYNYRDLITEYYRGLVQSGVTTEVIQENARFSDYDVICVPFIRVVSDTLLEKLQSFVAQGGKLIIGPMTGDRTKELTWPEKNGLGTLGEWLSLHNINQFRAGNPGQQLIYNGFSDHLDGLLTTFRTDETWTVTGKTEFEETLIAEKRIELGKIILLGGLPIKASDGDVWPEIIRREIVCLNQNHTLCQLSPGLIQYRRQSNDKIQLYVANMTQDSQHFRLLQPAEDLLTNASHGVGGHDLSGYACLVLQF